MASTGPFTQCGHARRERLRSQRALLRGTRTSRAKCVRPATRSPSSTPAASCSHCFDGTCWRRTQRSPKHRGLRRSVDDACAHVPYTTPRSTRSWRMHSASGKTPQAGAAHLVRRLFRLFRRSGRPRLGGCARAWLCNLAGWAREPAGITEFPRRSHDGTQRLTNRGGRAPSRHESHRSRPRRPPAARRASRIRPTFRRESARRSSAASGRSRAATRPGAGRSRGRWSRRR